MQGSWWQSDGRVRAGWRILVYLLLFFFFSLVGHFAASVLPRDPLGWVGILVSIVAALAASGVMLLHFDGRSLGALGFAWTREAPRELLGGLLVGGALLGLSAALLLATGAARFVPDAGTVGGFLFALLWSLAFFTAAAALEEVLFRGYAFQALVEGVGVWPAVLGTSALFAAAHWENPNVTGFALANIFLAGVLLAWSYLRTRSLWFATMVHAGWNWAMATLLDFPVSGLALVDTPLYDAVETGADWWTGGAFGPEAGLAGTLALSVGIAWHLRTRRLRESPQMRERRPLVDRKLEEQE